MPAQFRDHCVKHWWNSSSRKTVGTLFSVFWSICSLIAMSDHMILLLPAGAPPDMEIDHEVDAAPPAPPVVEARPTAFERRDITNWLQKSHRQIRTSRQSHLADIFETARHTSLGSEDRLGVSLRRVNPPIFDMSRPRAKTFLGDPGN